MTEDEQFNAWVDAAISGWCPLEAAAKFISAPPSVVLAWVLAGYVESSEDGSINIESLIMHDARLRRDMWAEAIRSGADD